MTELSFLVDLLLNHKLQKATKDALAERIKALSTERVVIPAASGINPLSISNSPLRISNQAPSMQAIMARNPDLVAAPVPVEQVAQTPAAAAALASRHQAIAESMAGKVDKVSGRPRKF